MRAGHFIYYSEFARARSVSVSFTSTTDRDDNRLENLHGLPDFSMSQETGSHLWLNSVVTYSMTVKIALTFESY